MVIFSSLVAPQYKKDSSSLGKRGKKWGNVNFFQLRESQLGRGAGIFSSFPQLFPAWGGDDIKEVQGRTAQDRPKGKVIGI